MGLFSFYKDKKDIEEIYSCLDRISQCLDSMRRLRYEDYKNMPSQEQFPYEMMPGVIFDEIWKIDRIVENGNKSLSTRLFSFEKVSRPIRKINQAIFDEVMEFKQKCDMGLFQEELYIWDEYGPNNHNK